MDESEIKEKHLSKNVLLKTYGKIVLTLENCLLAPEKFQSTPSFLDGLDSETETDLRILGCELVQTSGILLKLPQVAMASGQVLFQRFFYSKSFVRHDMEAIAMSCICLASKIEEAPRRIRDVINVFHHIKQMRANKCISPMILDQNYINLKSQVIKAERRVLKELGFCVHVKHPHKLIVMYLKYLDFNDHQEMMQIAWNFMNDSFRTDVFVRYQPESIACACIYLTARKLNICMPNNPPWFEVFKVSEDDLIDVCYRIMALYRREKPSVEKLESAVHELKKKYQDQRKKDRRNSNASPSVTVIDRNNGSHNAWGGFISRTLPANDTTTSTTIITGSKLKSENKLNSLSDNNRITSKGYDDSKSRSNSRAKSLSKSRSRSSSRTGHSRSRSPNSNKYNKKNSSNKKRTHSMSSSGGSDNEKRSKKRETKGMERKTTKHYSQRDRTREHSHEGRKRYLKNNGSSRKKTYSSNDRDKNYGSSGTGNHRYYEKDQYNSSNRNNGNGNRNSRSRDRR